MNSPRRFETFFTILPSEFSGYPQTPRVWMLRRNLIITLTKSGRAKIRGVDLIPDALPFGRLWYGEPNAVANAIGYAEHYSRSHGAVTAFTMTLAT